MNINRLIIAAGTIAYTSGVLLAWWADGAIDRTPFLYINLVYAIILLAGSVWSPWVRKNISVLMAAAIYSIQIHALYLIWENNLPPSIVASCSTLTLAPIATFGYAFKTLRQLLPYLLATAVAVLFIGLTVENPQINPAPFVITYISLAGVCLVAATGQLRTLETLRANSERQRALVDAIPDAMLRLGRDGSLLDSSIDASTSIGQILQANHTNLDLKSAIEQTLSSQAMKNFELEVAGPEGKALVVEARMVKSGADEVTAILRDMTDDKALKAQLMMADRMAALGTLTVGIGHEINNPLTYVEANLRFAIERLRDSESNPDTEIADALNDAAEGAKRVKRIVDDLKRSARTEDDTDKEGIANASSAMQFAVRVTRSQITHQAKLAVEIPDDISVLGTEGKLSQVFLNLLLNAMQSFRDPQTQGNLIEVRVVTSNDSDVIFEVRDNGAGISPEIRDRIFDPFFTTKDVGEGTGLGLYICHQIVAEYGGSLSIESEQGKGTTARVRLKVVEAPSLASTPIAAAQAAGLRILVIDDEPSILKVCERLMKHHQVTTCVDSTLALDLIVKEDFDAIFCDLMMPRLNGMQLFKAVVGVAPDKSERMIFITGGAFRTDAQDFLDSQAHSHLAKPFDRTSLLEALERVQQQRRNVVSA